MIEYLLASLFEFFASPPSPHARELYTPYKTQGTCLIYLHSYKDLGSLLVITNRVRHPEHDLHGP